MKKVVVFGAGYWGVNYIRELAGNLSAVIEPDTARAELVQQKYNVPVFPVLPTDWKYDGAIVATPPDTHIEIAGSILKTGRTVLIEKPIATSYEDALSIAAHRQQCMASMIYLYHPEIIRLKKVFKTVAMDHGFSRRTNCGPIRPWGDAMWDLASHDIAIFNYITGQTPIGIEAAGARSWAIIKLNYIAFDAAIYVSWLGGPKVRKVELVPADGSHTNRVIFDDMAHVLEVSPLRRMLDDFLNDSWPEKSSYVAGLEVIKTLEAGSLLPSKLSI